MRKQSIGIAILVIVSLLVGTISWDGTALAAGSDATVAQAGADRLIVSFKPGTTPERMVEVHKRAGGKVERDISSLGVAVVTAKGGIKSAQASAYRKFSEVATVEADAPVRAIDIPNDPSFGSQWNMTKIQAPEAWSLTQGSTATKIAILDSGIDMDHQDLASKIVAAQNFSASSTVDDLNGHGSHVAGIAAAATNNYVGVAGVARNARLINVKVLNDDGNGYLSTLIQGITWAADNGANVINLSLGGNQGSTPLMQAVDYAWNKGAVIVAAAGNGASFTPVYPAYYTNVISVAATDQLDNLCSYSSYGSWVDVAAPGSAYSTYRSNGYSTLSGTSTASPHVAGLAGLIFTAATDKNGNGRVNDEVRAMIENNTDKGTLAIISKGRINAYKAISSVAPTPGPGPSPPPLTGTVRGTVTNGFSVIGGATVTTGTISAATNSYGGYVLSNVPAGAITLTVSAPGYLSKTASYYLAAGSTLTANIALTAGAPPAPTPTNQPPVLNAIGNKSVNAGSPLTFTVSASDPNNDVLTYSASNLPAWATFSPSTHVFSGTPTAAGTYTGVRFQVSDGKGGVDYEDITITANAVTLYGQITGIVRDSSSGAPISGATVSAAGRSSTTGTSGVYNIANVPAGSYTATAQAAGYQNSSLAATVTAGGTTTVNFNLTKASTSGLIWVESISFAPGTTNLNITAKVVNPAPVSGVYLRLDVLNNGAYRYYYLVTNANGEATANVNPAQDGFYQASIGYVYSYYNRWDGTRGVRSATYNLARQTVNQPPVAFFTANPASGTAPLAVVFNGAGSYDPDGSIASYSWNFGDGSTSSGVSTSHTYAAGTFTATMSVVDNLGKTAIRSVTIYVSAPPVVNQAPVAAATANPTSGTVPLAVGFSATGSYDPDGSIVSYSWDFGDGATGSGAYVSHTYNSAGTFTATLTVTDNLGKAASKSLLVYANAPAPAYNQPPIANASAYPTTGTAPMAVSFSASGSYDPDGSIASYSWSFGDGYTASGAYVSHTYNSAGTYTATLTVTDNLGKTAIRIISINVNAPAPTPPPPSPGGDMVTQIFNLVNNARTGAGLQPLQWDSKLAALAQENTDTMIANNTLNHYNFYDRAARSGYSYVGENAAQGFWDAQTLVNAWLNSPGHRANIMNASFRYTGVSWTSGWSTQMFGG